MKRKLLLLTIALAFMGAQAFGQYQGLSQSYVGLSTNTGAQAGMPVAGYQAGLYQLTYVASGTVSTCTAQIQDSPDNITYTSRGGAQTCTSSGMFSFQATPTSWVRLNVTAQTGSGNVTFTLTAVPNTPVAISAPSGSVLTLPTIAGGLTASGSVANDFSGSTGAFKPSTGAFTFQAAAVAASAGANNFDLSASSGTFKTPTGAGTYGGTSNVFNGTTPQIELGVAGSVVGGVKLNNATSGSITVNPPTGALGSAVITLPALTGSLATGTTCGASLAAAGACPNTTLGANGHFFAGSFLLSGSTSTVTGIAPAFTSATSWWCVANDVTTRANPVQAIPGSGSTLVITNTTGATDLIQVICVGN